MFEIAQAAMNQTRRGAGRAVAEVALVDQQHFQPAHRSIASDAGTVDSAAYDNHVITRSSHHIVSGVHCLRQTQSKLISIKFHSFGPDKNLRILKTRFSRVQTGAPL